MACFDNFSTCPQGISSESVSEYVNVAVSSVDEGLIRQLLATEHCTTPKDEKEFVSTCA